MYNSVNSRYTYENSDVIRNKMNIKDEETLKKFETKIVAFKLSAINFSKIKRNFTENHFKAIHKYLFYEVYDFAGEYRNENITKENFRFSEYEYIEENIKKIFEKIDVNNLKNKNFDELISFISEIMTDLNVLHPFREGNGRTIREFIRELLDECGYEVDFLNVDYNLILRASILAVIDDKEQIKLLKDIVKKKKIENL